MFSDRMIQIQGKNDQTGIVFGGKLKSLLIVHFHDTLHIWLNGPVTVSFWKIFF